MELNEILHEIYNEDVLMSILRISPTNLVFDRRIVIPTVLEEVQLINKPHD